MNEAGESGDQKGRITVVMERAKLRAPIVPEWLLRAFVTVREVVVETFRGFAADRGADLAGSLAFTTLLTAVPLLATFSLFLAAFFKEKNDQVLEMVNRILPYHTAKLTESLREFVAESTAISGIGLVTLIVASVRLIFIVEATFNAVWGAPKRRAWFQRIAIYSFALFSLALLMGAIGSGVQLLRRFAMLETVLVSPLAETVFPFAAEFAVLTLLYHYLPNAYVRWTSAALAGGITASLLELLRSVFGKYVAMLSRMNLITGSLSFLLFALLSVYLVWVLILIGVELTHVLQTKIGKSRRRGKVPAGRAENAIRMLLRAAFTGFASCTTTRRGLPSRPNGSWTACGMPGSSRATRPGDSLSRRPPRRSRSGRSSTRFPPTSTRSLRKRMTRSCRSCSPSSRGSTRSAGRSSIRRWRT